MTIKVFISGICGSHEVRKQQQRVLFILQSLPIDLQVIDITEPGRDEDLNFMQEGAKQHDKKTQLPPQIFNDSEYCGDYADFEMANDDDQIMRFLKLESSSQTSGETVTQNGININNEDSSLILDQPVLNGVDNNINEDQNVELVTKEVDAEVVHKAENESPVIDEIGAISEDVVQIDEQSADAPKEEKITESNEEKEESD